MEYKLNMEYGPYSWRYIGYFHQTVRRHFVHNFGFTVILETFYRQKKKQKQTNKTHGYIQKPLREYYVINNVFILSSDSRPEQTSVRSVVWSGSTLAVTHPFEPGLVYLHIIYQRPFSRCLARVFTSEIHQKTIYLGVIGFLKKVKESSLFLSA